jgi:branched-chain amino acid transport system ATP-binding protein
MSALPQAAASGSPDLFVRDLWAGYGAASVLKGVSLQTRAGVTGLIGSNGAGKSTTLRTIAGLTRCTSGEIRFGARSIGAEPAHRIAQCGVILVPEGGGLFPSMSVEDNLLMGAYRDQARPQRDAAIRDALTACGVKPQYILPRAAGPKPGADNNTALIGTEAKP